MQPSQRFDYERPTHDSLAGINLEASDRVAGAVARTDTMVLPNPSVGKAMLNPAELFGLTVTVDDGIAGVGIRHVWFERDDKSENEPGPL